MTETWTAYPAEQGTRDNTLHKRMMRLRRSASLIGLVGTRQGVTMLAERIANPNADKIRTVRLDELEHPFSLTSAHSDIAMLNEIVGMGVYDLPGLQERIDGLPVVDMGANIGVSATLFASRYPKSTVFAVEPHSRNYDLLTMNAEYYGGRIITVPKAIGLETGKTGLQNPDVSNQGHHAVYEFRSGAPGDTATETLQPEELSELVDLVCESPRIGLMKINIEGEEKALLSSRRLDPMLERSNVAIIEAHDHKVSGVSDTVLAAASRTGLVPFERRGTFHLFVR